MLALVIVSYFWVDPLSFEEFGAEATSALLFYSNFYFLHTSGYFDTGVNSKILLHTWSLSVEWQFYLLYPLALLAAHRFARAQAAALLLVLTVASFTASVYVSQLYPVQAFYMLAPSHIWEFTLGGLLALYGGRLTPPQRVRPWLSYGGMAIILVSSLIVDSSMAWPAWATLPATLGTALTIAAGHSAGRLLQHTVVRALGLWSYSIYLWHWPLLALLYYFGLTSTASFGCGLLATLVMSYCSYRFVEEPARRHLRLDLRVSAAAALAGVVALSMASNYVSAHLGLAGRSGGDAERFAAIRSASQDWTTPKQCGGPKKIFAKNVGDCVIGSGTRRIMLYGDSFAEQLYPRMRALVEEHPELSVDLRALSGCPTLPDIKLHRPGDVCDQFNRLAMAAAVERNYDLVIVSSMWSPFYVERAGQEAMRDKFCFLEDNKVCQVIPVLEAFQLAARERFRRFRSFVFALEASGKRMMIMLPTPFPDAEGRDIPLEISKAAFLGNPVAGEFRVTENQFLKRTVFIRKQLSEITTQSEATLYDPLPELCPNGLCPLVDEQGIPIYRDGVHLRAGYMRTVKMPGFDEMVLRLAGASSAQK